MTDQADLDIILRWARVSKAFDVTILYNAPGPIEESPYFSERPLPIDLSELAAMKEDVAAYGLRLGTMLFIDQGRVLLDRAMKARESMPVNVRLLVDPRAPAGYQAIRWETLRRPGSGDRLTTSENIRFSRYLGHPEGRQPTPLARMGRLKALVAVADPADIADYTAGPAKLSAVDLAAEIDRARKALADMSLTVLPGDGKRATRVDILDALRDGVHALYLVCHGQLTDKGPEIYLEDGNGDVDVVDGASLAADLADLGQVPTIAVLCSCQSGGPSSAVMTSTAESLTALGPALAHAGTAVVVAMQGDVRMTTAATFLERFFGELNDDGNPARAMAVARSTVADQPDWFMPVLYSRLKRGSAWYRPRFGGRERTIFKNLHTRIGRKRCTPIVGSGIVGEEGLLPSRQELASTWAERRQMPISQASRTDLATVAQYVSVEDRGGGALVRDELDRLLRREMKSLHGGVLPDLDWDEGDLHQLIRDVGAQQRHDCGRTDAYSRLAQLELPVYVTTSWTSLLEDALEEAGRTPVVRHFSWYRARGEEEDDAAFTVRRPLVYHLFGTFTAERSLVLTEDDYFAWLRSWMKQVDKGASIPHYVKPPLMESSLMFLGYVFDDWEFRMVFQAVKGFEANLLKESSHVGVQFEPETLRVEREAAQEYLESYFGIDHVDIYWQTCNTFLRELEEARPGDG